MCDKISQLRSLWFEFIENIYYVISTQAGFMQVIFRSSRVQDATLLKK